MQNSSESTQLHVVMFPFFAFGHISPFAQLSNKLASHGVRISFLSAPGNTSRIESILNVSPTSQIVPLKIPSIPGIPSNITSTADLPPEIGKNLIHLMDLMEPQIKTLLAELKPHFVFFDFAQYWLPPLASELGIKTIFFSCFTAISSAYITNPARFLGVDGDIKAEHLKKPPIGFPPSSKAHLRQFEAEDFMVFFTRFGEGPTGCERVMTGLKSSSAIVVKSCDEMESMYLDFMRSQFKKKIFLTGPIVPEPATGVLEEKWDKWLSQFPSKSVVFCSFGSETFLSDDQIKELAIGLEQTGLPFFLVLNFPGSTDTRASLERALPEGFLERVMDRGVVHTGWVQQPLILDHESVGCHVCHSGFSSVIEAMVYDCQLVLVPFKGDQFLNAKLVSGDWKAGVEVKRREEDGYFRKEDIYEAVKIVMMDKEVEPGKSIRANHQKWKEFLSDKKIHDKFVTDLYQELKAMA